MISSSCLLTVLIAAISEAYIIGRNNPYRITCTDDPNIYEKCVASGRSPITEDMITDGDILLPEPVNPMLKNAIIDKKFRWPNATVPYVFHKSFTDKDKQKIRMALKKLEEKTCVRFVPWHKKGPYALITNDEGCHSTLGFSLNSHGYARVNIHDTSCIHRMGTIQHEFLHLLGLKHEHARPDRDEYVTVIWENIKQGHAKNFEKADPKRFTTFGLPYDYKSVMHYNKHEFSKNGKDTLEAKIDKSMELGQREEATYLDLEKIRKMYCANEKSVRMLRF